MPTQKQIIEQVMKEYEDGEIDYVDKVIEKALQKQAEEIFREIDKKCPIVIIGSMYYKEIKKKFIKEE